MAAASRYKKFLQLCEKWPLDKSKTDRDLGLHLRQRVAAAFPQGDATRVPDEAACDRALAALQRIVGDEARAMYPRRGTSTATGQNLEQCQAVTSTEGQRTVSDSRVSVLSKLRRTLSRDRSD